MGNMKAKKPGGKAKPMTVREFEHSEADKKADRAELKRINAKRGGKK